MEILEVKKISGKWALEFVLLDDSSTTWLILAKINENFSFIAWSLENKNNREITEARKLIDEIVTNTNSAINIAEFSKTLWKTISFNDWKYWGHGIPKPIQNHYNFIKKAVEKKEMEGFSEDN